MDALVREAERDSTKAKEELGNERNYCIVVEDDFTTTLEKTMNKKVVDALEGACFEAEVERVRQREKIMEEALEVAIAKYLALDAFGVIKANYFWKRFKDF